MSKNSLQENAKAGVGSGGKLKSDPIEREVNFEVQESRNTDE